MTSQQLFRLHWKNHSPNFVNVFSQLLNTESLVDVTLACDGQQIQAHRVVLSACSTYFQKLFVSNPCQHPIVLLKDIKFEDLHTVIHFMYYGEVNIQHDQLNSILKTAETLHVKGFADVADKESFSAALLTQQNQPPEKLSESRQHSEQSQEFLDEGSSAAKRKRQRHESGNSQIKSGSQEQISSNSPLLKRQSFQSSKEVNTDSSIRSSSSLDSNSVIKSQSSLAGQSSLESSVDNEYYFPRESDSKPPICSTGSLDTATAMMENGASCGLPLSKQKRTRTLMRQDCVTRKEGDKDATGGTESERASPIVHTFQPILPKTQKSINEAELTESRQRCQTTTYLQLPPRQTAPQLIRQRSQPIQPRPSGTSLSPVSGIASSTTPPPPQSMNIPTLAVTPVSSTPNIVIEHYPTIIRLVSIEEMNTGTDPPPSAIPTLTRAASCIGTTSTDTLQVPCFATDSVPSSSSHSSSKLRVKAEENLRRSISNPGVSSSPPVSAPSTNGHCPVLRTGAALGCNYCWNTNDSHGRILRRKTKYHCPDCQANLCIVPCFQEYHEKFVSSNETKSGGSQQKGSSTSHQMCKMSSF